MGKSTVGQLLAERLGVGYRDTDDDIVAAEGRSIAEIFVDEGEPVFRGIEKRAVHKALAEHDGILAPGGGSILDADTRALLAGLRVVYLSMDVEEAVKRTGLNTGRPLLAVNPRKQWRELMEARRHLYEGVATAVVATDGCAACQVVDRVLAVLAGGQWTNSPRKLQRVEGTGDLSAPAGALTCGAAMLSEDRLQRPEENR
uniref:Shikimate kinase n=1 Tax=Streptomyces lomondensis TaxID=68229 RepID=A0A0E3UR89_9ACTN|nr:shikimate kinase [Streptomyces lomondensis]